MTLFFVNESKPETLLPISEDVCVKTSLSLHGELEHFYSSNRSALVFLLDTFPDGEPVPTSPGNVAASPGNPLEMQEREDMDCPDAPLCGLPGNDTLQYSAKA